MTAVEGTAVDQAFDPDWITGQTGNFKRTVMLEISVIPLLTVVTCKKMHAAIIALDRRASEARTLLLVDL